MKNCEKCDFEIKKKESKLYSLSVVCSKFQFVLVFKFLIQIINLIKKLLASLCIPTLKKNQTYTHYVLFVQSFNLHLNSNF